MADIRKEFVDNLKNFTDSLGDLVTLMTDMNKKGGDSINEVSAALDSAKIKEISEGMKVLISSNETIRKQQDKILEEIKASRKQKENGMADKIEGKENKNKIVDGIKTVILIAAGVLAIGMAFKIIGKVDFLSVIALSFGMMAVAFAFAEIAKIEELDEKKTIQVGLALIAISVALTISSFFLKAFQPMKKEQLLSFVMVSAALGIGAFFIFKAIKDLEMNPKDMWKYLLLPIILPAIALGIVASSWVLKLTAPVGFMQALTAIFVGAALVVGAIAVYMVLKALKGKEGNIDIKGVGLALALIPGIAAGIVVASWAFQLFETPEDPMGIIFGSLAMGLAIIFFLPAVFVLGKFMKPEEMLMGALGAVIVSVAIMISSHILSVGNYGNYPDWKWALGVGLSLIMFTPAVLVLGLLAMTGAGAVAIVFGAGLSLVVADAIVGVSHILSNGKYDKYPSLGWALGVGLSLLGFTTALLILGIPGVGLLVNHGSKIIKVVANTIVDIAEILSNGNYGTYSPTEWANGVGLSIITFSTLMLGLGALGLFIVIGAKVMIAVASSIVTVAYIFNMGKYDTYPPTEWTNGVGLTIIKFSAIMIGLAVGIIPILIGVGVTLIVATSIVAISHLLNMGKYNGGPTKEWLSNTSDSLLFFAKIAQNDDIKTSRKDRKGILSIAESMVEVADVLSKGNFTGGPNDTWMNQLINMMDVFVNKVPDKSQLKKLQDFIEVLKDFGKAANKLKESGIDKLAKLTASVTIMSVIDDQKLQKVIGVLDNNKDKLSNVIEGKEMSGAESFKQKATEVIKSTFGGGEKLKDKQDIMIERFDTVIKKFDELLGYVISEQGPQNTGKNDSVN